MNKKEEHNNDADKVQNIAESSPLVLVVDHSDGDSDNGERAESPRRTKKNQRLRNTSASSELSDYGVVAQATTANTTHKTNRRRGRPSKKSGGDGQQQRHSAVTDGAEKEPAAATPPLPILKLRIPRALLMHHSESDSVASGASGGGGGGGCGGGGSSYRKVAVSKEPPRPLRQTTPLNNRFAQKLRSLNCKVDLQKFRFKVRKENRDKI